MGGRGADVEEDDCMERRTSVFSCPFMAPEGDPAARYKALARELAQRKTEYALNRDPEGDPAIEGELIRLRDALVALLDDPAHLEQVAAGMGRPKDGFEKARDAIRSKDVREWKQMS